MLKPRIAILAISVAAATLFTPVAVEAQQVIVAGDGAHLWILQPSPAGGGFTALYRKYTDDPATDLYPVGTSAIQGNFLPQGVTAGGGRLWLIYTTGRVQAIGAYDNELGQRGYSSTMHKSLPEGVVVKSLAANRSGPWILVRVEDAKALQRIDHPEPEKSDTDASNDSDKPASSDTNKDSKTDPNKDDRKTDDKPETKTNTKNEPPLSGSTAGTPATPDIAANTDTPKPSAIQADRLLVLRKNAWHSIPLPGDWPSGSASWLVMKSDTAERPWLVTVPDKSQSRVRWYEWVPAAKATAKPAANPKKPAAPDDNKDSNKGSNKDIDSQDNNSKADDNKEIVTPFAPQSSPAQAVAEAGTWRRYDIEVNNVVSIQPHASQQQLVLVHRDQTPGKLDIHFQLLRPDRVTDLGTVSSPTSPLGWSVAPVGPWLAVIIKQADGEFIWQRINVAGDIDPEPTPLTLHKPSHDALENMYLFLGVMIIATPITILLWRRNPQPQELVLPEGAALSDMVSRMIAALIDMVPCVGIAVVVSGSTPMDIVQKHWPGQGQGLDAMWPGAIAVGCFVVYTTLAEMFTGKTMGKRFLKLRVVTMKGESPDVWQILGRCLFKVFDLIVPLLILLAVFSPYRQRMGDLVARTVVVVETAEGSDEPSA